LTFLKVVDALGALIGVMPIYRSEGDDQKKPVGYGFLPVVPVGRCTNCPRPRAPPAVVGQSVGLSSEQESRGPRGRSLRRAKKSYLSRYTVTFLCIKPPLVLMYCIYSRLFA